MDRAASKLEEEECYWQPAGACAHMLKTSLYAIRRFRRLHQRCGRRGHRTVFMLGVSLMKGQSSAWSYVTIVDHDGSEKHQLKQ